MTTAAKASGTDGLVRVPIHPQSHSERHHTTVISASTSSPHYFPAQQGRNKPETRKPTTRSSCMFPRVRSEENDVGAWFCSLRHSPSMYLTYSNRPAAFRVSLLHPGTQTDGDAIFSQAKAFGFEHSTSV